jgi:hypothetical protein
MMEARSTARAAMQAMLAELHMVGDGGLIAASRDSVTVRVPYAFGMTCRRTGSVLTVSLMPYDSLPFARAAPDSMAIRDPVTGVYFGRRVTSTSDVATPSNCTVDSIRTVPGGRLAGVRLSSGASAVASKSLVYLSQTITYKFMTSTDVPGRRGLWRRVGSGTPEELAAPFDTTARFAFLRGPLLQVSTTAPSSGAASRDSVRGLELRLTGQSVYPATGASVPARFDLRTTLTFMNCKGFLTCTQP